MRIEDNETHEARRTIGGSIVLVRCAPDLARWAEVLLDACAGREGAGAALDDGTTVDLHGVPFVLRRDERGELVANEQGFPEDFPPSNSWLRILDDQEAVAFFAGVAPHPAPFDARVAIEKGCLDELGLRLAADDGGWIIGALGRDSGAPEQDLVRTRVAAVWRLRPYLAIVLRLPPGYRVEMDFKTIRSIENAAGELVLSSDPAALARLARAALAAGRMADLERLAGALLEATTLDGYLDRAERRLARRRGGGAWVAYANVLHAIERGRERGEGPLAHGVCELADELGAALSPGGALAGDVAPFAITENAACASRRYAYKIAGRILPAIL
jgi:hypothetical protein